MDSFSSERSAKTAFLLSAAVSALLAAAGWLVYRHEVSFAEQSKYLELKAVADQKASQISDWRARLASDVKMKASGISMPFVLRWLASPSDQELKDEALRRLRYLSAEEGYRGLAVVSPAGRQLLSSEPKSPALEPEGAALARGAAASREVRVGRFYVCKSCGRLQLDAAAPIPGPDGRPAAVLLAKADPSATLFVHLGEWLQFDPTAEVELVRSGDGGAQLANGFKDGSRAGETVPLSGPATAETAAVGGRTGSFLGRDLRGAEVIADLRPVPGTPWFMVTSVSRAAALAEASRHGWFIAASVLMGVLLASGVIFYVFRERQRRVYGRLWLAEKERADALEDLRFRAELLDNATDAIHAVDQDLRLVYVNDRVLQLSGYSREELIGEKIHKLDPSAGTDGGRRMEELFRKGFLSFETEHRRKDGSSYPAEVSLSLTELGGRRYVMCAARDITERRRAEAALKTSEEHFRALVEGAPEGIFIHSEGKVTYANRAFAAILGAASPGELAGRELMSFVAPDFREIVAGRVRRQTETGEPAQLKEIHFLKLSGETAYVENTAIAMNFEGRLSHLVFARDISARRRAELELRESLERFDQLAAQSRTGNWETDPEGRYTYASKVFAELTGYAPEELLKLRFYDLHPEEGREEFRAAALGVFGRKERFTDLPNPIRRKDGGLIWVATTGLPLTGGDGRLLGYRGADTDITARKKAEDALKESEAQFRLLVDSAPEGIFIQSGGRIVYLNRAFAEMLGAGKPGEIAGRNFMDFVPEDLRAAIRERVRGQLETGRVAPLLETRFLGADGRAVDSETTAVPVAFQGRPSTLVFARDISARKKAERALLESEERFKSLFEKAPLGYQSLDEEGRFIEVNQAWLDALGYERGEVLGRNFGDFVAPEFRAAFAARFPEFKAAGRIHSEFEMLRKDGARRYIAFDGRIARSPDGGFLRTHCILKDETERRAAEERLKASLAEKEVLLKEIHHRVKNNMQVVSSLINMQSRRVSDPAALEAFRESRARIRAMALVHEVLYKSPDLAGISMKAYFGELVKSLFEAYDASGNISLSTEIADGLMNVDSAVSLGLMVNELVSNSLKHAFGGGRGGTLGVALAREGKDFELTVGDDGPGLPEGLDPAGVKTLGLQLVSSLARQLGGKLEALPGPGARFRVRFPA